MTNARTILFIAASCMMPGIGFAQPVGSNVSGVANGVVVGGVPILGVPYNLVAPNVTPGGITLVPGMIVAPGVSGSAVTGTVPLAGTVGSQGVGNLNPGLNTEPNAPGTVGTLYPIAPHPQVASPQAVPNGSSTAPSNDPTALQNVLP
jgi:hypothetical protein